MDFLTSTLRITSVILTSVLGLASMMYDFKDATGGITRAGRRLLAGLIGSSVISISSTGLEQYQQEREGAAALKRAMLTIENSNRLLAEVNRSLHPLESVASSLVVELVDQGGATEVQRFKQQLNSFLSAHPTAQGEVKSMPGVFINRNGGKTKVSVFDKAKGLFPGPSTYPAIHVACTEAVLTLWLRRPQGPKPMNFEIRPPGFLCSASNYDLRIDFEKQSSPCWLTYEVNTNKLIASFDFDMVPKQQWENHGVYVSTLDLPRSAGIMFLNIYYYFQPTINFTPRVIKLTFSGEDFWIEKKDALLENRGAFRFIRTTLKKPGLQQ